MPILILLATLLLASLSQAATRYVDKSCANDGNGVGTTCASSPGGAGPWNSVKNALQVNDCSGMSNGDVLEIRGSTTQDKTCVATRSCYHEDNINIEGACHDITIQNYANEHVILDGTVDIKSSTWTSIGSGVYQCQTSGCAGDSNDAFPFRSWYKRGSNAEEELDLIQTSTACNTSLAAGKMTVVAGTTQTICVHLSDGSSPASSTYFRIPWYDPALQAGADSADNITLRKNPLGGTFRIQRYRKRGIEANAAANTGWVIDGLEWAYHMDRCIAYSDDPGAGNIQIRNNNISFCGQEGIRLAGDTGTWVIEDNTITDIQTSPVFERCSGIGEGCRPEFTDNGTGIRLINQNTGVSGTVRGNVLLRMGGGMNNRARMINFEHANNHITLERNYLAHSSGLANTGAAIMWSGSFDLDKNDNINVRNNVIYDVDRCFWIQYGTDYDSQAGTNNYILNNTCAEFKQDGLKAESGTNVLDGAFHVKNNVFSVKVADVSGYILDVQSSGSTGWTTLQNNVFECDACTANQDIITWRGVLYERDEDCTSTVDCVDNFTTLSGAGYTGNKYGDINVNTSGGTEPDLTITPPSEATDAGQALTTLVPDDYTGEARPAVYDAGAYNIDVTTPPPSGDAYDIAVTRVALDNLTGTRNFILPDFSLDCTSVNCAAIFVLTKAIADDTAAADAVISVGFTDGMNQITTAVHDNDAVSTTDSKREYRTDNNVMLAMESSGVTGAAEFYQWSANGVWINTTDAMPENYLLTIVLMGGEGFQAKVGTFTSNAAVDGTTDVNTVGFLPDAVFLSSARLAGTSASTMLFTLGAAVNDGSSSQGSIGCYANDGVAPNASNTPSAITSTLYAASLTDGGGQDVSIQVGSWDAQGFTATTKVVGVAAQFGYFAFNLGGADFSVFDMNTRTATGLETHTLGYRPLFAMVLGTLGRAYDVGELNDGDAGSCMISFGTATASGQFANTTSVQQGVGTSNSASFSNDQGVFMASHDGACSAGSCFRGSFAFEANSLDINYTSVFTDAVRKWVGFATQDLGTPGTGGPSSRRGAGLVQ